MLHEVAHSPCAMAHEIVPNINRLAEAVRAHGGAVVHPVAPPPPAAPVPTPEQLALKQGIDLYKDGNYNEAIKHLSGAPEIWSSGSKAGQLEALKYMAFCYCVTGRTTFSRTAAAEQETARPRGGSERPHSL